MTTINDRQASILTVLEASAYTKKADILAKSGIKHTTYNRSMADLIANELVLRERIGANNTAFSITMSGIRVLADYNQALRKQADDDAHRVPPSRHNKMLGIYMRPAGAYYRNNGNAHIQSRGVAC